MTSQQLSDRIEPMPEDPDIPPPEHAQSWLAQLQALAERVGVLAF